MNTNKIFKDFLATINEQNWRQKKIVLAASGGLDSMTLAQLLYQAKKHYQKSPYGLAGFDFVIAHVNYNLRAEDSISDAAHVKKWATLHQVPYYEISINTLEILNNEGGNLQATARDIRYSWFEELRKELAFDYIATAHHIQDSVETVIMNFFKGTGISGLQGIPIQRGRIIRPLIKVEKESLRDYAIKAQVMWREDASNQKTDYLRNQVRLELMPLLEKQFPHFKERVFETGLRLREVNEIFQEGVLKYKKMLLEKRGKDWYIPLKKLVRQPALGTLLLEILKPFGMQNRQIDEVIQLIDANTGKKIIWDEFYLIKNRDFFIITAIQHQQSEHIPIENLPFNINTNNISIRGNSAKELPPIAQISNGEVFLDADKIKFPLTFRPWKEGDYFYPMGMGMKKKKIKKLLIDLKVPLHEKEHIWVVTSQQHIIWVGGLRADERFKVSNSTKDIIHLQIENHR